MQQEEAAREVSVVHTQFSLSLSSVGNVTTDVVIKTGSDSFSFPFALLDCCGFGRRFLFHIPHRTQSSGCPVLRPDDGDRESEITNARLRISHVLSRHRLQGDATDDELTLFLFLSLSHFLRSLSLSIQF